MMPETGKTPKIPGMRSASPRKTDASKRQAMILRIILSDTDPPIHRTILVPSHITLPKLHVTILTAMGWSGGHLHEFVIDHVNYGEPDPDFPQHDL